MWNSIQQVKRVKSILENFVQGTRHFSFITWYEPRNYEYIFLFMEWCFRELVIYASQNIMKTCIEDGLFWSKSKVSSQSRGIDGSIYEIRQKATYLLCYSFNIAENRYDKQSLIAGASNLVKNTQKSNFEKEVSWNHLCFDVLFKARMKKGLLKITDIQKVDIFWREYF